MFHVLVLAILFAGGTILDLSSSTPISNSRDRLQFNQNGTFRIVNFADLHFGEHADTETGPIGDLKSQRVMSDILSWEEPDLVVYTGDQIHGDKLYPNASTYVDMLVKPLVEGNYRWAQVYGNHDIGPNVTREEILATEQKYNLSYTRHGEKELPGVTNYYLFVYPPMKHKDEKPALVLWFFDTQGGHNATFQFPSLVDEKVVAWFNRENQNMLQRWGRIPALAFFHIPTIEYEPVQESVMHNPLCSGLVDDKVIPQDKDTGFMEALVNSGTVRTTFVGHDHGNAWCCFYKTLELCYNRHTGYNGYGDWTRGARVVEVSYNDLWGNFTNYIRLEDGSVIDRFPKV